MNNFETLKKTLFVQIQSFIVIKKNKRDWHIPLLAALCVGIPLFIGLHFGNLPLGLAASIGGLVILYYQPALSLGSRMLTLLVCSFGFSLSLAIGLGFSFNPYVSAVVLGFFAMGINWVTTYFRTKPPGNFFFIMIASMASCQPFHFELIPQKIGFIFLGTMLACLLALCHGLLTLKKQKSTEALAIHIEKGEFVSLIDSAVIGIFISISLIIGHFFEMQNPYWIPISCLAILQGVSRHHVWERMVHRIVGTFIGIGLCWIILLISDTPLSICISIFVLLYIAEALIIKNYALAIIFITPMTILLTEVGSSFTANTEIIVPARFLDITIGSILGAIGGWIIYNQRFKNKAVQQLRKTRIVIRKKL
ncbi:FUSC family protein [Flavobacterium ardleyense]|uniref:FUSC family protein n=1 Tax=Flavobacterium ardleyense TaxID=2038737 RepID=A0ABW5ZAG9_9FLAO